MPKDTTDMLANLNKRFIQYVAETKKDYKYTIKLAIPEVTDQMIDCLEMCLLKYELKSASPFKTTLIQESPLDFPNVQYMPVHMSDIVLGYPASHDFLRTYLGNSLGISPQQIAIYMEYDPRQVETDLFLDRTSPEYKEKYIPVLDYEEHVDKIDMKFTEAAEDIHYGDKYNTKFLQALEQCRKEREMHIAEGPLSQKEKVDHSMMPKDYNDFNNPSHLPKPPDNAGLFGRMKKPFVIKAERYYD